MKVFWFTSLVSTMVISAVVTAQVQPTTTTQPMTPLVPALPYQIIQSAPISGPQPITVPPPIAIPRESALFVKETVSQSRPSVVTDSFPLGPPNLIRGGGEVRLGFPNPAATRPVNPKMTNVIIILESSPPPNPADNDKEFGPYPDDYLQRISDRMNANPPNKPERLVIGHPYKAIYLGKKQWVVDIKWQYLDKSEPERTDCLIMTDGSFVFVPKSGVLKIEEPK
jgi:hypothetical protein